MTNLEVLENRVGLPLEDHEEDWKELMQRLELPLSHLESVQRVLEQLRWRKAIDPVPYLRTAARREHRKLERGSRSKPPVIRFSDLRLPLNKDGTPLNRDEAIDRLNTAPLEGEWETPYAKQRVRQKFLIADSPHDDAQYTINYTKLMDEVATVTGLSKTRRDYIEKVLELQSVCHITREQILSYPVEAERKRLQAALKWIQRNRSLLAKILSKTAVAP
jgi:hypothetical protein